ncbi:MAG: PQQ-binding-like beta-propeller repeat protein [Phycisphaerae bacterium]|nr:PQQ-binding-like beta-propeller repeat protein [Tepidisphaeraceae bacterium]
MTKWTRLAAATGIAVAAMLGGCERGPAPAQAVKGGDVVARPILAADGVAAASKPGEWLMWGKTPQRNMVSDEKGVPTEWQVEVREEKDGKEVVTTPARNIKWVAQLGSQSYGNPIVTGGLVIVGTNNESHKDPKIQGDASCLMIFDAQTGSFLWQRVTPKHPAGRVIDWPYQGVCSTVCVEGDTLWYATPNCEVVCLDLGPTKKDKAPPKELWVYDMMKSDGVFPHNMTACSTFVYQDWVFFITGNGVDETHKNLPAPDAPSVICFEKKTGKKVWSDKSPGKGILHGQYSSPAFAEANGVPLCICPLGNGWVYAYDCRDGKVVWQFDANLKETTYPTTRNELISTPVIVGNLMYLPNGQDPEHGEGPGHIWCVDITKKGDVSLELAPEGAPAPKPGEELVAPKGEVKGMKGRPNPNSGVVWHFRGQDFNKNGKVESKERMNRTISTVAVFEGLVYAPDFSGYLHCFDAKTGERYWVYDTESAMWSSPMIADGKVFLTNENGDVNIFPAGKKDPKDDVIKIEMGSASYCSPVFTKGVLYLMTRDKLYAIEEKK